MTDVESTPSSSSFALSAYKERALLALAVLVPPAAIAVSQGKADLESRHLALSLALYLSVICYMPAVVHAYWLLYVRDNGGVEEWSGARIKQAKGLWNDHGGFAKTTVDKYSPKVIERYERVRDYITDWVKYIIDKKNEAVTYVRETITAAIELFEEAREAYATGTLIDWTKEQARIAVEKVKARLEPYPRLLAFFTYFEQSVVPFVIGFLTKIYETIRGKIPHVVVTDDVNGGASGESRDESSEGETAEDDAPLDESSTEGRGTEEDDS